MENVNISKFSMSSVEYKFRKMFCKWMKLNQTSFPMELQFMCHILHCCWHNKIV